MLLLSSCDKIALVDNFTYSEWFVSFFSLLMVCSIANLTPLYNLVDPPLEITTVEFYSWQ